MPICIICQGNIIINDSICYECNGTGEITKEKEDDLLNPNNWDIADIPF